MDLILVYLAAIAAIDVALAITIQRKVSDAEKAYVLQSKTKKHMSDLQEMMKNKASKEALSAKQQELNKSLSDHTMHQMRSMPILLVLSVAFYFFILPSIFPLPLLSVSPANPLPNQSVSIAAHAPAGTNDTVGVWLSGGSYGSGNIVSTGRATDLFTGTFPQGNYSAKAYDLNSTAYSTVIALSSGAHSTPTAPVNSTTSPVYNLLVYKVHYNSFQDSIYFIIFTVVISLSIQMILGKRDKKKFEAKYGPAAPAAR